MPWWLDVFLFLDEMDGLLFIVLVIQTIRISLPYLFAALGGTFSERGGVINIALEGILLSAAFVCVLVNWFAEPWLAQWQLGWLAPWLGLLGAVITGIILGFILSIATITFKADQIICGLAINIFAYGFTKFFCYIVFASPSNSEAVRPMLSPGIFSPPFESLNQLFHPLVIIAGLVVVASQLALFRTPFGLRLRAVGEDPATADTLGVPVSRYRYFGVVLGCAICALGGAWMALDQARFAAGMSAGRGYIALAAMIVGNWKPRGALLACLGFGFAETLQMRLQASGVVAIPNQLIQMLPYVLTLVVLAGFVGKSEPPAADGKPYLKELD